MRSFHAALVVASSVALASSANAQTFMGFHCRDGSVFAIAILSDAKVVSIQLDGKPLILSKRWFSLFGTRYSKSGVTLSLNGNAAKLSRRGQTTLCDADQ
jgi:hypothetical protein